MQKKELICRVCGTPKDVVRKEGNGIKLYCRECLKEKEGRKRSKKLPYFCIECQKRVSKLQINELCSKCNQKFGLRECSKCHELKFIDYDFDIGNTTICVFCKN